MAQLSFRINAEWEKVQKLREEIARLKQEIKGVDAIQSPASFNILNSKLQQTSKELNDVTGKIVQASVAVETDFKQKIFAASQCVNGFTEEIIKQKKIIADTKEDIRSLSEQYRSMGKFERSTSIIGVKLREAKNALAEQQYALFQLTQEQATARLSVKNLRDEYALFRQDGGGTAQTMDLLTSKMKGIAATIMGGMGLKELGSRIISVRADFERMETSLKVLLGGNEQRLNSIMGQIKEYALASPLNTKDMVGAVQMMTSFGIEAEKSIDYLKAIGDISMGDTGKFNSLALAFSQMSSAGKLMGQDLMQMVNAGFNPLEEIARKTGKSIGELKDEMSKGAITSKMVQDAFISVTSEGGKFFGMSQEGAKTLNGQISMLQESFDMMFNEIGGKGEGVVMTAVQMATKLVENYEQVGKIVMGLVATYGLYKAMLVTNIALERVQAINRLASIKGISAMSVATGVLKEKVALLNGTMLASPYFWVAAAIVGTVAAVYKLNKSYDTTSIASKNLEDANKAVSVSYNTEIEKLNKLKSELDNNKKGTDKWKTAKDTIINQYGQYDSKLSAEIDKTGTLASSYDKLTNAIRKSIAARQLKDFYDKNTKDTQDRIQEYREKIFENLKGKYGERNAGTIMKMVNEYISTGRGYGAKVRYKKNGKWTTINFAELINNRAEDGLNTNATYLWQARKFQINGDSAIKDYANMNGLSRDEVNSIIYGIQPSDDNKEKKTVTRNRKYWEDKKKDAQARLEALNSIAAKGKEGQKIRNEIAKYDKELKSFDTTLKGTPLSRRVDFSKMNREQVDKERKLENDISQSRIDAMQEGYEKEKAQRELNHKKELEDIDKQRRDYLQKKIDDAREIYKSNHKGKDKGFKAGSIELTKDESAKFDEIKKNAKIKQANEDAEAQKVQLSIMRDYLKEYGSFQDQKAAINEEYNQKIANADNVYIKAKLAAERDSLLSEVDFKSLRESINWEDIFNSVEQHSTKYLKSIKEKLRSALNTKDITAENAKVLAEKIQDIETTIGKRTNVWSNILPGLRERKRLTEDTARAQEALNKAIAEQADANFKVFADKTNIQEKLKSAGIEVKLADINEENMDALLSSLDKGTPLYNGLLDLFKNLSVDNSTVNKKSQEVSQGRGNLNSQLDKLKNMNSLTDLFGNIGGDPLAIAETANKNIQSAKELVSTLGVENTDFGVAVGKFADGANEMMSAVSSLTSGDVVGAVTHTINGFQSWAEIFRGSSNHERQLAIQEDISKKMDILNISITKLTDKLDKSYGAEAIKTKEDLDEKIANNQKYYWKGLEAAGVDNYGRGHSDWYHWNKNSSDMARDIARNYNVGDVRSWQDLFDRLSKMKGGEGAKILDDIRTNHSLDWWYTMQTQGYNDGKMGDWLTKWADSWKTIEESQEKLKERITGTTEENVFSDFMNSLNDLANGSEDVFENIADNWQKMINKMVLNNIVGAKYQDQLKKWYEKFSTVYSGDKKIDARELSELKEGYNKIVNSAKDEVDALKRSGLINSDNNTSQKATANGVSSITYEQANNIVALTTAGNISRDQIKDLITAKLSTIDVSTRALQVLATEHKSIADELRTIQANSYIELQGIHEDTTAMNKTLKSMSSDMSDIKKTIKDM